MDSYGTANKSKINKILSAVSKSVASKFEKYIKNHVYRVATEMTEIRLAVTRLFLWSAESLQSHKRYLKNEYKNGEIIMYET